MQRLFKFLKKKVCRFLCWFDEYAPCEPINVGSGSGGSGNNCHGNDYAPRNIHHYSGTINLLKKNNNVIGQGYHRSGWPRVVSHLSKFDSNDGILVDDFVEQNFCYNPSPNIYKEPWIGIFHHPPFPPAFSNKREWMSEFLTSPAFLESKKWLKLAIVLSEYHRKELIKYVDCPVVVILHPVEGNFEEWNYSNWHHNRQKQLVQVGRYLRNTQLVNQIPHIEGVSKIRLVTNNEWSAKYDLDVLKHWKSIGGRHFYDESTDLPFIPASGYDKLLASNIVVMELFDASATNGVLDCIIRNTPIIVNRHPAVVEYLGDKYPLYFNDPEEIPALVKRVSEGHNYLKSMDKSRLTMEYFSSSIFEYL